APHNTPLPQTAPLPISTRHTFNKGRDGAAAPVIPRTNHQIVSLRSRTKRATGSGIDITAIVIGAGKAGHDAEVPIKILIELSIRSEEHTSELQSPCNLV